MELIDSPSCRRCGAEEKTSAHVLCQCEAVASLRHTYLGSFSFIPEEVTSLCLGINWNFSKGTGLPWFGIRLWGITGPTKGLGALGPKGLEPCHYSILFYSRSLATKKNCRVHYCLTFIGPRIANIFAECYQQDATFHNLFISVGRSTCFRRVFSPSSGAQNCTDSVRYLSDQ